MIHVEAKNHSVVGRCFGSKHSQSDRRDPTTSCIGHNQNISIYFFFILSLWSLSKSLKSCMNKIPFGMICPLPLRCDKRLILCIVSFELCFKNMKLFWHCKLIKLQVSLVGIQICLRLENIDGYVKFTQGLNWAKS